MKKEEHFLDIKTENKVFNKETFFFLSPNVTQSEIWAFIHKA